MRYATARGTCADYNNDGIADPAVYRAGYWSIRVGDREAPDAAWFYADPTPAFAALRDHVAFYPSRVDACTVDGERVAAQEGDFYGGWITKNIVGPFKGGPGTWGW